MFIWSGFGFLVPVIFFVVFGLEAWLGDRIPFDTPWRNFAVFALAGTIFLVLSSAIAQKNRNSESIKILWWKELIAESHSCFFIPLRCWGLISLAIGIYGYVETKV